MVEDLIKNNDLSQAIEAIKLIVSEAPDNHQAKDLNDKISNLEDHRTQLTELAHEAETNDKFLKARKYYMEILEIDKNYEKAKSRLASINQYIKDQVKKRLSSAKNNFDDKNIKEAKRQYLDVMDLDQQNENAKKALAEINRIEEQIALLMQAGKAAFESENYYEAEEKYKKVLDLEPQNKEALKVTKEIKQFIEPAEDKQLAIMLKEQKLEFFPESGKRLNFGELKEKKTVQRTIQFKSLLDRNIELGLHGCNWKSKKKPLDMTPIELFDSPLLTVKPNEAAKLQISLTMYEGTELPGGQYTGELLFKDSKGEYDYRIPFLFRFNQ